MSIPGIAIVVDSPKLAVEAARNSIGAHVDAHSDSANEAEKERSDRSAATRRKRRLIISKLVALAARLKSEDSPRGITPKGRRRETSERFVEKRVRAVLFPRLRLVLPVSTKTAIQSCGYIQLRQRHHTFWSRLVSNCARFFAVPTASPNRNR
jgi:hypothetical protein